MRNTGLLVLTEAGHVLRSTTLKYPLRRRTKIDAPISEADHVERLLNIANDIVGFARDFNIKHVAIEDFAYDKRVQAHQLGQVAGVVKTQLWLALRLVAQPVGQGEARKFLLGHGRPKKENIEAVVKAIVPTIEDDHQADAYVVVRWLFHELTRERDDDDNASKKEAPKKRRRTKQKRKVAVERQRSLELGGE